MREDGKDWYLAAVASVLEHTATEVKSLDGEPNDRQQREIIDGATEVLVDELALAYDTAVQEERSSQERMGRSILTTWGHALDFLDFFILVNQRARRLFEAVSDVEDVGEDYQFDALMRVHVRALRVSREIAALLRSGFANGAFARWRTLYEIAAVSNILAEADEGMSERYLKFKTARDLFEVENHFDGRMEQMGLEGISDETVEELKETTEQLIEEFGPDFDNRNGWAADFVEHDRHVSVVDLLEASGLDLYLPYYAVASDAIHGGPKGTLFQMGLHEADQGDDQIVLSAGRSDIGFTDPAQLTVIMLQETTESLRVLEENKTWQAFWEIYFDCLDVLVAEIIDSFWLVDQILSAIREEGFEPRVAR